MLEFALSSLKPGHPYGSLVFGRRSVAGAVWVNPGAKPFPVRSIEIVGGRETTFPTLNGQSQRPGERRYSRQLPAIGRLGQFRLGRIRVAIVGLGGIGSIVARTLAYEGVRNFVLIDFDRVDKSSLNRLDGATPRDAWLRRQKVRVLRREIRRIAPDARVSIIARSVFCSEAFAGLVGSDVIFGCTDNEGTRLYLNEVAAAYLKPYFDSGTGITAENGIVSEAGGRVTVVLPGNGCLLCAHAIDVRQAGHELSRPEFRAFAVARGYVAGEDLLAPSVMSLNQTVASLAVTEFKALAAGLRAPIRQLLYDLMEGAVSPGRFTCQRTCLVCQEYVGKGDCLSIEHRYRSVAEAAVNPPGVSLAAAFRSVISLLGRFRKRTPV
ncbi:MAG: ThiF family adenylyltransferase [Pirellulales bacterium]